MLSKDTSKQLLSLLWWPLSSTQLLYQPLGTRDFNREGISSNNSSRTNSERTKSKSEATEKIIYHIQCIPYISFFLLSCHSRLISRKLIFISIKNHLVSIIRPLLQRNRSILRKILQKKYIKYMLLGQYYVDDMSGLRSNPTFFNVAAINSEQKYVLFSSACSFVLTDFFLNSFAKVSWYFLPRAYLTKAYNFSILWGGL